MKCPICRKIKGEKVKLKEINFGKMCPKCLDLIIDAITLMKDYLKGDVTINFNPRRKK